MPRFLSLVLLVAQAEPAPPDPEPPPAPPAPATTPALPPDATSAPPTTVAFAVGLGYRLPPAARDVAPAIGFSLQTSIGRRYLSLLAGRLELGLAAAFAYERYVQPVSLSSPGPGEAVPYRGESRISAFDFVLLQTAAFTHGRIRAHATVGGGLGLGHFLTEAAALAPGESRAANLLVQVGVGIDVRIAGAAEVGLRLDEVTLVQRPVFETAGGDRLRVFGDRIALRAALAYRF